jgi:hypothetical protein
VIGVLCLQQWAAETLVRLVATVDNHSTSASGKHARSSALPPFFPVLLLGRAYEYLAVRIARIAPLSRGEPAVFESYE